MVLGELSQSSITGKQRYLEITVLTYMPWFAGGGTIIIEVLCVETLCLVKKTVFTHSLNTHPHTPAE